MKPKKIVMSFYDGDGKTVPTLCKNPARPEDVMAALQFLDVNCVLTVEIEEFEVTSPA